MVRCRKPIVLKEILLHLQIRLHILKVQTLKHKAIMEKYSGTILCSRNTQSKVPDAPYLSPTPKILVWAPDYYATRPRWR